MGAVLQCLFRVCSDVEEDDDDDSHVSHDERQDDASPLSADIPALPSCSQQDTPRLLFRMFRHHEKVHPEQRSLNSPLQTACTFYSTGSYPTLGPKEVVLPGSQLQHEMAQMVLRQGKTYPTHHADECVICLEGFDDTNPRMPTQCGCGTNQTYFHLPCLYQWMEQCEECPTCRQTITWHEFC